MILQTIHIIFTIVLTFYILLHFLGGWIIFSQYDSCSHHIENFFLTVSIFSTIFLCGSFFFSIFTYIYNFKYDKMFIQNTSFKYLLITLVGLLGVNYDILIAFSIIDGITTLFLFGILSFHLHQHFKMLKGKCISFIRKDTPNV
jgi:hypothetical protein